MRSSFNRPRSKGIKNIGQFWLIVFFLISLCLPSLYMVPERGAQWFNRPTGWVWGIVCLSFPVAWLFPPWWANPCFFVGMVSLRQNRATLAFRCGVLAIFLSVSTVVVFSESDVSSFGPGYFLWLILLAFRTRRETQQQNSQ